MRQFWQAIVNGFNKGVEAGIDEGQRENIQREFYQALNEEIGKYQQPSDGQGMQAGDVPVNAGKFMVPGTTSIKDQLKLQAPPGRLTASAPNKAKAAANSVPTVNSAAAMFNPHQVASNMAAKGYDFVKAYQAANSHYNYLLADAARQDLKLKQEAEQAEKNALKMNAARREAEQAFTRKRLLYRFASSMPGKGWREKVQNAVGEMEGRGIIVYPIDVEEVIKEGTQPPTAGTE